MSNELKSSEFKHNIVTLDFILQQIGQCGKFQIIVFLLISVPMILNAIFSVTYVFTAGNLVYRYLYIQ